MDPASLFALGNVALGLFGGHKSQDPNTAAAAALYRQALTKSMNLYDTTDFGKMDQAAYENDLHNASRNAQNALSEYDAGLSAQGIDPQMWNSENSVRRGVIANQNMRYATDNKIQRDLSRPFRQAQLLNPSQYAGGVQAGATADAMRSQSDAAYSQGLSSAIGNLVSTLYHPSNPYKITVGY